VIFLNVGWLRSLLPAGCMVLATNGLATLPSEITKGELVAKEN
jgi:hypothetical protein